MNHLAAGGRHLSVESCGKLCVRFTHISCWPSGNAGHLSGYWRWSDTVHVGVRWKYAQRCCRHRTHNVRVNCYSLSLSLSWQ